MRPSFKLGAVIEVLVIISIPVTILWYFQPKTSTCKEDFEEDLGGWSGGADVPADPNKPGSHSEWNVSRVTSPAKSGQDSVELYID